MDSCWLRVHDSTRNAPTSCDLSLCELVVVILAHATIPRSAMLLPRKTTLMAILSWFTSQDQIPVDEISLGVGSSLAAGWETASNRSQKTGRSHLSNIPFAATTGEGHP